MIKKITLSAFIGIAVFLAIAFGLVFSQDLIDPDALEAQRGNEGLDFGGVSEEKSALPELLQFSGLDGTTLDYRFYESATPTQKTLILVHGSGWHSQQFLSLASFTAGQGLAHVITPDLRGHGMTPVRRGDVDYIGQFEDDLAQLIKLVREINPTQKIILGGHSSGGGLVVRFAGGIHGEKADAFLLMAPYLKYNAPTTRENSGGWARPLTRRIIGLSMLNSVGFTNLNALPVIQFNMPAKVRNKPSGKTATLSYSHRLNTSFAPRNDFEKDLAAMKQPFFLVAGSEDEAFFADKYEAVISAQTSSGQYEIVPDLNHLGIVQDEAVHYLIADWISQL